jgi:galactose mutarotase-like enzyme
MDLVNGDMTLFVSHKGATVTGLQYQDRHVIFPQQMVDIQGQLKKRGGVPIPFPWFGPHTDSKLPQHGFLRDTFFEMPREIGANKAMFILNYEGGYTYWPWRFTALVTIMLNEMGFSIKLLVNNAYGEKPMPINPAFHPYFAMPEGKAEIYFPNKQFKGAIGKGNAENGIPVAFDAEPNPVEINIPSLGTVTLNTAGATKTFVWTDNPGYVCVEPVRTPLENFNAPQGLWVAPGDQFDWAMNISFEPE